MTVTFGPVRHRAPVVLRPPRNHRAIQDLRDTGRLNPRDALIVSFVGDTDFADPHLYADPGVRYDWTLVRDLYVTVVVKPGIDVRHSLEGIDRQAQSIAMVDFESKVCGWLHANPFALVQCSMHRPGGSEWKRLFA